MAEYIETITWHEIAFRETTDEERAEYIERGYADYEIPNFMYTSQMPSDGDEILIATRRGVDTDVCCAVCDGLNNLFALEKHGDWDDVLAWTEIPKYKGER